MSEEQRPTLDPSETHIKPSPFIETQTQDAGRLNSAPPVRTGNRKAAREFKEASADFFLKRSKAPGGLPQGHKNELLDMYRVPKRPSAYRTPPKEV